MEERSTETIRNAYKGNVKHGKSEAIAPKWVLQSTEAVMQYYLDRDLTLDRCVLEKFPLPQEGHKYMLYAYSLLQDAVFLLYFPPIPFQGAQGSRILCESAQRNGSRSCHGI